MAAERGFDTSQFFPGYLAAFKGPDGKTYGFPKDGNTLAMAYNTDMLTAAGITAANDLGRADAAAAKLTTADQPAPVPEQHARPGTRVHLPERRLPLQRRQDPEHGQHAGGQGRPPDVPRLLQERPGCAREDLKGAGLVR